MTRTDIIAAYTACVLIGLIGVVLIVAAVIAALS